jgi:hypothetical protein
MRQSRRPHYISALTLDYFMTLCQNVRHEAHKTNTCAHGAAATARPVRMVQKADARTRTPGT